ncbi:DarT ssDNA thymidine ADP-ribosyltransferase family protein [Chromobacterium subtsugae]|uniref:DarT ssDNA thymidine ADP-ribosyltransferase family protein n=1 Tax=Chromobacterium subtsugae TaxID=251747 RepID=UPI0007F89A39|nr:DarT ssDNA thymidine ADP-ribosyltransferase family protein [Chromobacterium subtsugae]
MTSAIIKSYAEYIEIPYLIHFTRVTNLESILTNGLLSINQAELLEINPAINDELRLDGHLDATSVSISFPNSSMFFKYRQNNPDVGWVVLGIKRSVLWTKDCAFCKHNAATAQIAQQDINHLKTPEAFGGMFDKIGEERDQRLKPYDPTDVQAEVLVFETIEPELIFGVGFDNHNIKSQYQHLLEGKEVIVCNPGKSFFASRSYVR